MVKRLLRFLAMNKKLLWFIFFILIAQGIFLRFYNLRLNTQFNWDQENSVAFPAKEIIFGRNLPLIGPRTGIGDLRLGPLYLYLAALFFAFFRMDPISGAVLAGILSSFTLVVGFVLVKKIFDFSVALYFSLIWATSTFIISLERIPWNVNLFPLSSLLVASGLWLSFKGRKARAWILTGLGLFLGVNSHFSVVLLVAVVLLSILLNKRIIDRRIILTILFLLLGLLPLIIFEIRHGFILSQNLFKFFAESTITLNRLLPKAVKTGAIILESIGRLLFFDETSWIQQTVAILFLCGLFFLRKDAQIRLFIKVFGLYLLIYLLSLILYAKITPEYYYLGLLPIAVIGYSLLFTKAQEEFPQFSTYLIIFLSIIFLRSLMLVAQTDPQGLGAKQQLVAKIKEISPEQPAGVVYDMELGHSYGYEYLLYYYNLRKVPVEESDNIFWISYPKTRFPGKADYIFGNLALGVPVTSKKIFNTKELELYSHLFKLRIPKNWQALQCPSLDFDKYLLSANQAASCISFDKESTGIAIYNLPNCNIWEMEDKIDLKISSELPFFVIPSYFLTNIPTRADISRIVVTAFERDRCIIFKRLERQDENQFMEELITILEDVKR